MATKIEHIAELRRSVQEYEELTAQVKRQLDAFEKDQSAVHMKLSGADMWSVFIEGVFIEGVYFEFSYDNFCKIVRERESYKQELADIKHVLHEVLKNGKA